ncbi:MAG: hypothetical protein EBT02_14510, partial [Planctomycetia bacterium]|nr:hypothetical protein [Planctomycetia bacterium]
MAAVVAFTAVKAPPFVTPLFQEYDTAPEPESVTNVPAQTVRSNPALVDGKGLTVTVTWSVFVQPLASVPVTVYVVVIAAVVAFTAVKATPFDTVLSQTYVVAPEPESVTDAPAQTVRS